MNPFRSIENSIRVRQNQVVADLLATGEMTMAVEQAEAQGPPPSLVGREGRARGLFAFEERWRPGALGVIRGLVDDGLDVAVLTGDHPTRGRLISETLGIPIEAELLPDEKVAAIERARRAIGPVAMVGDGIDDAPTLAARDAGIALGCGTDLSRDSASVCLLGDDLGGISWSLELAPRTRRIVRGNLIWAFG
jgi:P-type E1-E2 ATPase